MRKKTERRQQHEAIHSSQKSPSEKSENGFKDHRLSALTLGQKNYIREIINNDVTICTGPPGTGKTHVACGLAVEAMRKGHVQKIVLSRPVGTVEKEIGYLPGSIRDKLGPYLMPLFDELSCFVSYELIKHWMDTHKLEIVPLSAMRGRTFKDSFVVLDEAQNATYKDLHMFMTRFGHGSRVVASGDLKQTDHDDTDSLGAVIDRLWDVEGVGIVHLNHTDVVRHELTSEIDRRLS